MFNKDFYPTLNEVIGLMLEGEEVQGKVVLEPSAGKGNIVDYLQDEGAKEVLACEIEEDLRKILNTKCNVIGSDFLSLSSDRISHIDMIVMNPPFSADERHILHAYDIAPPGCQIISLCNLETLANDYTQIRKELRNLVESNGSWENLGDCFADAERKTGVNVALIKFRKPGENYKSEFEGFFMEDEPEEAGEYGVMSYNVVRDLVQRYVGAIKIFDEQLESAVKLNKLLSGFYGTGIAFQCTDDSKPVQRDSFKKNMQRAGWKFIFDKMDMTRHTTRGLMEDINKFVEQQSEIPFTMKNIYHMLDMVMQTASQRMDKALLEVFDSVTSFHDDNKQGLPGWKTNSHYLLTKRFIHPHLCPQEKYDRKWHPDEVKVTYGARAEAIDDMVKALCYITGESYENMINLRDFVARPYRIKIDGKYSIRERHHEISLTYYNPDKAREALTEHKRDYPNAELDFSNIKWGQWFDWAFFRVRAYKKGTMHFEFKDSDLWGKFNQRIAKLKGYPLFEAKEQTAYQSKQSGRHVAKKKPTTASKQPTILATIKLG